MSKFNALIMGLGASKEPAEGDEEEIIQPTEKCWHQKLRPEYFENLWPRIVRENVCANRMEQKQEFFKPTRLFDIVWAHRLLGTAKYGTYSKPVDLRCNFVELRSEKTPNERLLGNLATPFHQRCQMFDETEGLKLHSPPSPPLPSPPPKDDQTDGVDPCSVPLEIPRLDKVLNDISMAQERRQRLSAAFAMRKYPWYMKPRRFDTEMQWEDNTIASCFTNRFEYDIIESIYKSGIKIMIVDMNCFISKNQLSRWLKFYPYIEIVIVTRCTLLERQLRQIGDFFHTVQFNEKLDNSWQMELEESLNVAIRMMHKKNLYEYDRPVIFVFSSKQDLNTWDTYKVLRKS